MSRLLGLILFVLAVWAGVEIFDKGVDGAFGGLFTGFRTPAATQSGSLPQRIGAKVRADMERGAQRDGVVDSDDQDTD